MSWVHTDIKWSQQINAMQPLPPSSPILMRYSISEHADTAHKNTEWDLYRSLRQVLQSKGPMDPVHMHYHSKWDGGWDQQDKSSTL